MNENYPTLSLKERDRRWKITRELMKSNGIQCLIIPGSGAFPLNDGYLCNDHPNGAVIFPLEGDPTCLCWNYNYKQRQLEDIRRGGKPWVMDWQAAAGPAELVALLQQKGYQESKMGVVGLGTSGAGVAGGSVPYSYWVYVVEHLPKATFVDITGAFAEMMAVKSEEELVLARRAARIGEMACEAMMKTSKPGVGENEILTAIEDVIYRNGAFSFIEVIMETGPDNLSWGAPIWLYRAGPPRIVQKGDLVQAEISPAFGGLQIQAQMAIALAPVDPVNRECAEVAHQSYLAAVNFMKPGRTFHEVCEVMKKPLVEAGCWQQGPLIHRLTGSGTTSAHKLPPPNLFPDMKPVPEVGGSKVLKRGMVYALEPEACKGHHRVNLGGTVIVTDDGVEELNQLGTQMKVLG